MKTWVKCPICGESGMECTTEDEGFIIDCVNLACASNGGSNYSELDRRIEAELPKKLEKLAEFKKQLEKTIDCIRKIS